MCSVVRVHLPVFELFPEHGFIFSGLCLSSYSVPLLERKGLTTFALALSLGIMHIQETYPHSLVINLTGNSKASFARLIYGKWGNYPFPQPLLKINNRNNNNKKKKKKKKTKGENVTVGLEPSELES